ncbi:hypothetical protein NDU88_005560 [Pleurodeles waltl]|uniref:Uncharacterized protein n=1 Tax=Pleurodeles waltl TaxID=8319 RepID=A0AAV7WBT2_PLEWA|nr:hypothetical protein NDU88_005560 [Pleurodeles waltl]
MQQPSLGPNRPAKGPATQSGPGNPRTPMRTTSRVQEEQFAPSAPHLLTQPASHQQRPSGASARGPGGRKAPPRGGNPQERQAQAPLPRPPQSTAATMTEQAPRAQGQRVRGPTQPPVAPPGKKATAPLPAPGSQKGRLACPQRTPRNRRSPRGRTNKR